MFLKKATGKILYVHLEKSGWLRLFIAYETKVFGFVPFLSNCSPLSLDVLLPTLLVASWSGCENILKSFISPQMVDNDKEEENKNKCQKVTLIKQT